MDLLNSLKLAGRNLELCLCPTGHYLPYHKLHVDPDGRAKVLFYDVGHNIGRWWDAMLRLEDASGYQIDPKLESAMLENTRWFFDNSDNLCFNPPKIDTLVSPSLELHSLREGLLSLSSLIRFRNNRWAAEQAHRMLETLHRISGPDTTWDINKLEYYHRRGKPESSERYRNPNVSHSGRLIEALVWHYETTGDSLAIDLADRLAAFHLENSTNPDGSLNTTLEPDHTHSYLGTLRGLLLFGLLTNQREYVDSVAATYRITVPLMVKESGWCSHNMLHDGRAEVTSPGDTAQIAMWLALYAGQTDLLDDVERIVRARILPSQITELPVVELPAGIDRDREMNRLWGKDEYVNVGERIMGAYGGMQLAPQGGKRSTTDITAAVVHTLVDVYNNITSRTTAGLNVNFHFDKDDENALVTSKRGESAAITVTPKSTTNLFVRVPIWAPSDTVRLYVDGNQESVRIIGNYAYIPNATAFQTVILEHALPIRRTTETTEGIEFEFEWRGNEITGVCPNTDFFPFYSTLDGYDKSYDQLS